MCLPCRPAATLCRLTGALMDYLLADATVSPVPDQVCRCPGGEAEITRASSATRTGSLAWSCLAAATSGALMSACYWPLNAHAVAWFAMVPGLSMLPRLSARDAWMHGTLLGLVFYRVGLNWLFAVHGPLAGLLVLGLAVWMGLAFWVARLLMSRLGTTAMLWSVPLAFAGQEILRCEGLPQLRFPFLALGYSQSGNLWIAQAAELGGVYLLSLMIVLVNTTLAWAVCGEGRYRWAPATAAVTALLILAAAAQPGAPAHAPRVAAAVVQVENQRPRRLGELARQALADASRPRLLVLPEHTILEHASPNHPLVQLLAGLAREFQAIICVGAHTRAERGAGCAFSNVSMFIGPDGRTLGEQPKLVPVPFIPDGNPGGAIRTITSPRGRLGTYVCYDGLFTDIPRRVVEAGAELLLVPSMDAADWPTQERRQHADMALFRSIELRRCALRANGAGVSQIIDAGGRIMASRTEKDGSGVVFGSVYPQAGQSVFRQGGYLIAPLVGIAYLLPLAWLTLAPAAHYVLSRASATQCRMAG
jgi:apolipoprotein N-acyltransferase